MKNDGSRKVSEGLSGDALNKKIALDFINSIKQQKGKSEEEATLGSASNEDAKPQFKFSRKKATDEKSSESKAGSLFQSSHGGKARVMQTFEFGQKQTFA